MSRSSDVLLSTDQLGHTLPDGRTLFAGLSLGFGRERTGLVGRNGTGKTTLARMLAGEVQPAAGAVVRHGRVAYLPQARDGSTGAAGAAAMGTVADALGVAPRLRALDRVLAGSTAAADYDVVGDDWDLRERVVADLSRFGLGHLPLDRPMTAVSGGEATRIGLARRVLERPDFLILDEPTNDLDGAGRASLYRFVDEWRAGLLVITHDRALLERVDRIVELSGLGARVYGGGWSLYEARRSAESEAGERELAHARKSLRETERAVQAARERQERRTGRAHRTRHTANLPKILIGYRRDRGEATTRRLGEVGERRIAERRERIQAARARLEVVRRLELKLAETGLPAGRLVAELTNVSHTWSGADAPVLADVSLTIVGPERVAITGANGSGKTTLLRILTGDLAPSAGSARLALPRDSVAYLDQRAGLLRPDLSVLDNVRATNPDLDPSAARHLVAQFLFRGEAALPAVGQLSGGERLRAALACTLGASRPPQLLVLDEPTNHLDLDSLRAVEDVVAAYDGALVVVSHDESFLDAIGIERRVSVARPSG